MITTNCLENLLLAHSKPEETASVCSPVSGNFFSFKYSGIKRCTQRYVDVVHVKYLLGLNKPGNSEHLLNASY